MSVCREKVCLEHSIFILLTQIFKLSSQLSFSSKSALRVVSDVSSYFIRKIESKIILFFGSDRSSRNTNLWLVIRSFGPSLSLALNLHFIGSRALREHSASIRTVSHRRSLKYFILFEGYTLKERYKVQDRI